MTLIKYTAVATLCAAFLIAQPPQRAHAGKFLGGVAVGAAGAIIGHKIYKNQKRKKARSNRSRRSNSKRAVRRSVRSQASIDAMYDIQTRLNALNLNAGSPDGIVGRQTRNAVRTFQSLNNLPVTGTLSNNGIVFLYEQSNAIITARTPGVVSTPSYQPPNAFQPAPVAPNAANPTPVTSLEAAPKAFVEPQPNPFALPASPAGASHGLSTHSSGTFDGVELTH